jgi:hypothetical protein
MKNILAENMLRFGVKNLSDQSKKKVAEQTPVAASTPLAPAIAEDQAVLLKMASTGLQPYYGKNSKLLYIPSGIGQKVVSTTTAGNVIAYGIDANIYINQNDNTDYIFPSLSIKGNISIIPNATGALAVSGLSTIKLADRVVKRSFKSASDDKTIVAGIINAESWNKVSAVNPIIVETFVKALSGNLQLKVDQLTMANPITAGIFADSKAAAAKPIINTLGVKI